MMNDKIVHVISHSHWDREWYMPFEKHRVKLIQLIDDLLELFKKDDGFKSFHLDGQMILIEDYLDIKPQNEEILRKYIKEGRLIVGPWYVLQDEFLTSGEANVRNLLVGLKLANHYGQPCKIGYFPDAFGNVGQMPQLLKQAGIDAVVFGRGVKPVGFNNQVNHIGEYESVYSEMYWKSPDQSQILGILFANWYNNGSEIPVDAETAKKFWDKSLADANRYCATPHLLLMNGCDHQPVQKDLAAALNTARRLYPQMEFVHSNFENYIENVKKSMPQKASAIMGELTSQDTDGWLTLVNTTSARIDLKKQNRKNEILLEKCAEPLSTLASLFGGEYKNDLLIYAWKILMENHPHDSICGCSIDAVNSEMEIRFQKSMQIADTIISENMEYIGSKINTDKLAEYGEGIIPFMVFNPTGWKQTRVIMAAIDIKRRYKSAEDGLTLVYDELDSQHFGEFELIDTEGRKIAAKIEDKGVRFGYDLPEDKFRQPYMARYAEVTFETCDVPSAGYTVYALKPVAQKKTDMGKASMVTGVNTAENEYIAITIREDGTLSLLHKNTQKTYENLCYYEETGDIGNEYIYRMPTGELPVVTKGHKADIELIQDEPFSAVFRIKHTLSVPKSGDDLFYKEILRVVEVPLRKGGRTDSRISLDITTYITIECGLKGVKIKTVINNLAKDHRVRIMIPACVDAQTHFADSTFEVVHRNNRHSAKWTNPSGCEHQQCFVAMQDETGGLLAANIGLYEYEILPDTDTIAITLLRCVAEMGDWGVFPTPKAQLPGIHESEILLIPYESDVIGNGAYIDAYQFQSEMPAIQLPVHKGTIPLTYGLINWEGAGLNLTGMKCKDGTGDIIIRWVNVNHLDGESQLYIEKTNWMDRAYRSNILEEELEEISYSEGIRGYLLIVKPYEIVTVLIKKK